jgi:hypothetical protein
VLLHHLERQRRARVDERERRQVGRRGDRLDALGRDERVDELKEGRDAGAARNLAVTTSRKTVRSVGQR